MSRFSRLVFLMRLEYFSPRRKAYAFLAIESQPFFGFKNGSYRICHLANPNGRFPVFSKESLI